MSLKIEDIIPDINKHFDSINKAALAKDYDKVKYECKLKLSEVEKHLRK